MLKPKFVSKLTDFVKLSKNYEKQGFVRCLQSPIGQNISLPLFYFVLKKSGTSNL